MKLKTCPRCFDRSYEKLRTHSYCINCNYCIEFLDEKKSKDDQMPIPSWAHEAAKNYKNGCSPIDIEKENVSKEAI